MSVVILMLVRSYAHARTHTDTHTDTRTHRTCRYFSDLVFNKYMVHVQVMSMAPLQKGELLYLNTRFVLRVLGYDEMRSGERAPASTACVFHRSY